MKIVGLIPYWLEYSDGDSGEHKNLKKLGGRYLLDYSVRLLNNSSLIEDVYLYASTNAVQGYISSGLNYRFLQRPENLDGPDITIEDIIDQFIATVEMDVLILLHPNSPFLRLETLEDCVKKVCSGNYPSAFTASEYKNLAWFNGQPLNYSLEKPTPTPKEVVPVIIERSSLYVFTKENYMKTRKRTSQNAYIKIIDHFEGHEVHVSEDYKLAELIVNSGMYTEL